MKDSMKMENLDFSTKGKVVIKSNIWTNNLIQNQKKVLSILSSKISKVDIKEISLDSYGRIVINNSEFVENIKKVFSDPKVAAALIDKINSLPRQV